MSMSEYNSKGEEVVGQELKDRRSKYRARVLEPIIWNWGLLCRNSILESHFLCLEQGSGSWTWTWSPSSGSMILDSEPSVLDAGPLISDAGF